MTERVIAYQRKSISGGDTLETIPLDLPETSFETEAVWFSPTPAQLEGLEEMPKLLSSLHAAEHSLIALLPLWAMCDRWDIGGLSTNIHRQTGLPTIFVYDGHAGGVGITERGFERFEGWVEDTAKMLAGCPCAEGCPSCVQSPKCGNLNDYLDKDGALTLLRRLSISPRPVRLRGEIEVREEERMQYLALIYGEESRWANLSPEEREREMGEYIALSEADVTRGGSELDSIATATTVRVRGRRDPRHRRPVRRAEGGARRLLRLRVRLVRRGLHVGGEDPGRQARRDRGAAGVRRRR